MWWAVAAACLPAAAQLPWFASLRQRIRWSRRRGPGWPVARGGREAPEAIVPRGNPRVRAGALPGPAYPCTMTEELYGVHFLLLTSAGIPRRTPVPGDASSSDRVVWVTHGPM